MFRLLTANLYNGRADPEALAGLLDVTRPDVVATQELGPSASEVIAARFDHGVLDPSLTHDGMGLVGRSPLTVVRHPLPHRDAVVARGKVTIWSTHLANPVGFPPPVRSRGAQVRELASAIGRPAAPTLLVGDLNSTAVWPAYRQLTENLDDLVLAHARRSGRRPRPTWGYPPGRTAMLRIDHVLGKHARIEMVQVLKVRGSDHRAVVVDVEPL